MRPLTRALVVGAVERLPLPQPIYEFGAYQVEGQEKLAELRPLFSGQTFVGADMRPGKGVDQILDLHALDLPDASVGTVISLDTLEHVEYPHRALSEIHRVLRDDGWLIMTSVMNFPIHDYPHDYWRFTPQAFESLLKEFAQFQVESVGDPLQPHTVAAIATKHAGARFEPAQQTLMDWSHHGPGMRERLREWVPPAIVTQVRLRRLRRYHDPH